MNKIKEYLDDLKIMYFTDGKTVLLDEPWKLSRRTLSNIERYATENGYIVVANQKNFIISK